MKAFSQPGRVRGDRDRLDERERVLLHEHAVLERPRLRLVGVADEVVRARGLLRDRLPLQPGREGGAAASEERRRLHELDDALRAELARARERAELAVRLAGRDAPQELVAVYGKPLFRELDLARVLAGDRAHRSRGELTQAEARRGHGALGHRRTLERARQIGTHVQHVSGPLLQRDERVERRDAVRLRRRNLESARRIAERTRRHPADSPLRRAQRGQQEVAPRAVAARDPVAARSLRADDGVDRLALRLRRLGGEQLQVRQPAPSGSRSP